MRARTGIPLYILAVTLQLIVPLASHAEDGETPDLPKSAKIALRIALAGGTNLDEQAQAGRTWALGFLRAHPRLTLAQLTQRIQSGSWEVRVRDRVEVVLETLAPLAPDTCVKIADLLHERAKTEARSLGDEPENRELLRETNVFAERMRSFLQARAERPFDDAGNQEPTGQLDQASHKDSNASNEIEARVKNALTGLSAEAYEQREEATKRLYSMGADAEPYLRQALDSKDPEVCERVRRLLVGLNAPPPALQTSAWGQYRGLLKVLDIPKDRQTYGDFHDYGSWSGNDWQGHADLPKGFWVYVAPNWYIWKEEWKPEPR